ncbi:MAG TPA: hypothetical protein VFB66_10560 [Tepidisphaeraceae bacterium]|nr:hypothetical protein [Tepidisphaeraceae bacterium]
MIVQDDDTEAEEEDPFASAAPAATVSRTAGPTTSCDPTEIWKFAP